MPQRSRAVKRILLDDTFTQSQDSTPSQGKRRSARHTKTDQQAEPPLHGEPIVERASLRLVERPESFKETYESLPDHLQVFAPVHHGDRPFTASENAELVQRAEGFVVDSRIKGHFGQLDEFKREIKRKVGDSGGVDRDLLAKVETNELWLNAHLAFPNLVNLPVYSKAWTPFISPPLLSCLPPLSPQPMDRVPPVGSGMPLWSTHPVSDIDPVLDDLSAFEHGWERTNGAGWGIRASDAYESVGRMQDGGSQVAASWSLDCDDIDTAEDSDSRQPEGDYLLDTDACRTKDPLRDPVMPPQLQTDAQLASADKPVATDLRSSVPPKKRSTSALPCLNTLIVGQAISADIGDWDAQAKIRKQWWRMEHSKPGHGDIWYILPRPHTLLPRVRKASSKGERPPDYNLPRYFTTVRSIPGLVSHPFHPDLGAYTHKNPHSRVHWAIPISGPVLIPTYFDPISSVQPPSKAPLPTPAILQSALTSVPDPIYGVRPIVWTPQLLKHVWEAFLIPLHADDHRPFGPLSVMISGPKPDPYIALKLPSPLEPWSADQDGEMTAREGKDQVGTNVGQPVRPELGDHIRLYCPLRHALSLRTWINGIEIDLRALRPLPSEASIPPASADGPSKKLHRIFERSRLVLVGPRGEVLTVA